MNVARDQLSDIYCQVENLFPESIHDFDLGQILIEINSRITHINTGIQVDILGLWGYNNDLFRLLDSCLGIFITFN
jgi:hypothetical protein